MIRLDCEDLKRGLADAAKDLAHTLLTKVTDDHRAENKSIIQEFLIVESRALLPPEDSEELMSMVQFVEKARTTGMVKLNERLKNAAERLDYLLETYLFESSKYNELFMQICAALYLFHIGYGV